MTVSLSANMEKEVSTIMLDSRAYQVCISCLFYNNQGSQVLNNVVFPRSLTIIQDTLENYTDWTKLVIDVPIDLYERIQRVSQDLKCTIILNLVGNDLEVGDEIYRQEYFILVKDRTPLTTAFTTEEVLQTKKTADGLASMEMELIPVELYQMRKQEFYFTAQDATVSDVIRYAVSQMGISTLFFIPPDNEYEYKNFVIPPSQKLSSFIDYVQNAPGYGIYKRGISYYLTQGVLYIFPMFDTDPQYGATTHLYNAGNRDLVGLPRYHRFDVANNLHIVIPGSVNHEASAQRDIENVFSGRILHKTENQDGDWVTIDSSGNVTVNKNYGIVRKDLDMGIVNKEDLASAKICASNNNPYQQASEVASVYKNRMACSWANAVPLAIKPGHPVKFHYDVPDDTGSSNTSVINKVITGVMEKTVYQFQLVENLTKRVFCCDCQLQLAVEPIFPI
jgi:hypothetical protein